MKQIAIEAIEKQLKPQNKCNQKQKPKSSRQKKNKYPEKQADHAPPMTFYNYNRPFEARHKTLQERTAIIEGFRQILSLSNRK